MLRNQVLLGIEFRFDLTITNKTIQLCAKQTQLSLVILILNHFVCNSEMESSVLYEGDLNLKATELRLGLPGTDEPEQQNAASGRNNKRSLPESADDGGSKGNTEAEDGNCESAPAAK